MKFTTTKYSLHSHKRRAWKTSPYREGSVRLPAVVHHKWRTIKVSNGNVVPYTYDNYGRLKMVKHDNQTITYEYDAFGNLVKTTTKIGSERLVTTYKYDNMNRLITLTNFKDVNQNGVFDTGEGISEIEYTLNDIGQKTKALEKFWADYNDDGIIDLLLNNIDWEYDSLGRLTSEVFDHYANENDQTSTWEYDIVGNRLRQEVDKGDNGTIDNVTTYEYDENDRILKEKFDGDNNGTFEKQTDYGYDHTQQTSKSVSENGILISETTFAYDAQGRMAVVTIITENRKEVTKYEYGADGIRVSAEHEVWQDGELTKHSKTEYLNDALNITGYSQVLKQTETDVVTGEETVTMYVIGHQRISQTIKENGETKEYYFTFDGHGSTRGLTDFAGAIVQLYSFDAYGNALGFNPAEALTEFLYSGEQFDSKIGQQYLRARYYDPATGRFNRLDPFFGNTSDPQSFHKYLYTHADPVNGIDPNGLMSVGSLSISIGNIGTMVINNAQTAFRVYQFVQKTQTIIEMMQLIASLTTGFPAIQQEVMKEIQKAISMGNTSQRFRSISTQDILDGLNTLAKDFTDIAPLIAGKHSKRILDALASLKLPKSKRDVIIIYMPGLEGRYTGESKTIKIPALKFMDMDVEMSTTTGGGRLVGVGLADPKKQRQDKNASYQIFRVDWHDTKIGHTPPYVGYFHTSSGFEFHWVVPPTIKEAQTGS